MNEHELQQEARIEALEDRVAKLGKVVEIMTDLFGQQQELNKRFGEAVGAL